VLSGVSGPEFQPAGAGGAIWRQLVVTVTPAGVEARWDGQPFAMSAERLAESVARDMEALGQQLPGDSFLRSLRPIFSSRGGVGIFLARGSASIRSVTLTPLPARDE
jgi:hypothetical protein